MAKREATSEDARPLDASCRIVVLHGDEIFLRHLYTQSLRDDLAKTFGEIDLVTFDGKSAKAADVLDECRSFGLIAAHKLVIVDEADEVVKEDNRPLFERYAQSLIENGQGQPGKPGDATATLVLRTDTWRAGNLDKQIAKVGTVIKCAALPEDKAVAWATTRARKQHGATIERAAAELLVSRIGSDLARIDSELGKLASAVDRDATGTPAPITPPLVAQFVGRSREEEVWGIQSTLLNATAQQALAAMREALDVSRHPAQLVFFAVTDLSRKMHALSRATRQGMNPFQLRGPLKLWGAAGDALMASAKSISPEKARRVLRACLDANVRDRTGLGESVRTLERVAVEFTRR